MMNPPHSLQDALNDSITSGTFVDTKFYVFSRRQVSGRVGSPRALYCNSRILDTVPYFSTLFSDSFSEGQTRDINEGFPLDFSPYTEHYDYLSDSDLEDEPSYSEEEDRESLEDERESEQGLGDAPDHQTVTSDPPSPAEAGAAQNDDRPRDDLARMGKVAIIRDMGAVTFEAMLYYLYTGEIEFAPFSSDPRHELPAQARIGDWNTGKLPSPSAKSVYRLADKYDIPILKEKAKAYIQSNLEHCDIVEEVFSSFSSSFPEILSMQVPRLIYKIKEESKVPWVVESVTKKQLREKIAALPQPGLARAMDALTLIWNGVKEPLEPPTKGPKFTFPAAPTIFPNWHRVKLALLKSIYTGAFIDVQFCAYNAISSDLPSDPRPLFASSIVIEEWSPAITMLTVGIDSQAACPVGGPTDDYESWGRDPPEESHKSKAVLRYQTEATLAEGREVMMLTSGAWKTWTSFLSYAYTNEITFVMHWIQTHDSDPVANPEAQRPCSCSPRSMYSLAATLGIKRIKGDALECIQSKLSDSNVAQELFSSFTASHKEVLDMEIQFIREREMDHQLLIDHIRRMASGGAPFFPTTLSLVYDKLVEKALTERTFFDRFLEVARGARVSPAPRASTSSSIASPSIIGCAASSSNLQAHAPTRRPAPLPTTAKLTGLRCVRCGAVARLQDLYAGLYCPQCQKGRRAERRAFMECRTCGVWRTMQRDDCCRKDCGRRFM